MAALALTEALVLGPELTISQAGSLRDALLEAFAAVAADAAPPALDLSGVTACDTAGVQLLLAWRASLAERGWPLRLAGVSAEVADTLALYGLGGLLAADTPPEAITEDACP